MGTALLTLSLRVQPPVLPQEVPPQVELPRLLEPLRLALPLPRVQHRPLGLRPLELQQQELLRQPEPLRQRVLLPERVLLPQRVLPPQQVELQLVLLPALVELRQVGAFRQAEVHLVVDRQRAGLQRRAGLRRQGVPRLLVRVEGELRQGVRVGEEVEQEGQAGFAPSCPLSSPSSGRLVRLASCQ